MAEPRILLAHSPQGAIYACQCGAIHMVAGEILLSFSLEEFVVMLELHHQAISGLESNIAAVVDLCRNRCVSTIASKPSTNHDPESIQRDNCNPGTMELSEGDCCLIAATLHSGPRYAVPASPS